MSILVEDAHTVYVAAVRSVQPDCLLTTTALQTLVGRPLEQYDRIHVVGAGKATMAMAGALEVILPGRVLGGQVVVPHGYPATLPAAQHCPVAIDVVEAGHPVPDAAGVRAAEYALQVASSCTEDDLLLVLLSGGGSALWTAPASGIPIEVVQEVSRALLLSGADIHQVNTVRKHLSRIKGGRLARAAHPATLATLVISDVPGDDLSVIASGPTVPDRSTCREAVAMLKTLGLWNRIPGMARDALTRGSHDPGKETPKAGDACFARTRAYQLAGNGDALIAACAQAEARGYRTSVSAANITGEAREAGRMIASSVLHAAGKGPRCFLWGGETTVTVTGAGRGGRNQEIALAAGLALEDARRDIVVLSAGTDGIDGPTDIAGAWVSPDSIREARSKGLDPNAYLADNNTYAFFRQTGAVVEPGPTHTNVMDVVIALTA